MGFQTQVLSAGNHISWYKGSSRVSAMFCVPERHKPFTLSHTEMPTSKKIQASKSHCTNILADKMLKFNSLCHIFGFFLFVCFLLCDTRLEEMHIFTWLQQRHGRTSLSMPLRQQILKYTSSTAPQITTYS